VVHREQQAIIEGEDVSEVARQGYGDSLPIDAAYRQKLGLKNTNLLLILLYKSAHCHLQNTTTMLKTET
jgi:hypothetical protein